MDYKSSGVDIAAGNDVVRQVRRLARSTFTRGVLSDIGSFGGLFRLGVGKYRDPVLVSSTDGVGTKLQVAFLSGEHHTVGVDLVNHCVNDILVQGAEPLFFLDYLATGRLEPDVTVAVMKGLVRACTENRCALLGGETAEMPGFYEDGQYDLAGFIVGVVERERLIVGDKIKSGDCLIGIPSSGLHTNGYSLARKIMFEKLELRIDSPLVELNSSSVGDVLLRPHRSYLKIVSPIMMTGLINGMAHITGGGLTENLPRILPKGTAAVIDRDSWNIPPIFTFLQDKGEVPIADMYRTFNMGIGFVIACADDVTGLVIEQLNRVGEPSASVIGRVIKGERNVHYKG